MEDIGWAIIGNLHILFAVAIGGSWAKERAGGAFAAILAFILINRITGAIFGVTADMLADQTATVNSLLGADISCIRLLYICSRSTSIKYGSICRDYFRFLRSNFI